MLTFCLKKTVLVYSGKLDFVCNYLGGAEWTRKLVWPGQAAFESAPRNEWSIVLANGTRYAAGTSRVAHNLAWLEVNMAGHMVRATRLGGGEVESLNCSFVGQVPMDQPEAALQMINRFLRQGWRT